MNKSILYISNKDTWQEFKDTFYEFDLKVRSRSAVVTKNGDRYTFVPYDIKCPECITRGMSIDSIILGDAYGVRLFENEDFKMSIFVCMVS